MKKILLQLDTARHASVFDAVVATDAGVDVLLTRSDVDAAAVTGLVHGAMFTRGGNSLRNTAIFVGGGNVSDAEGLMRTIKQTFFGPVRVSVMMDANGCNTTAAAAVVAASRHVDLAGSHSVVLGGTGPVGGRVARMLAASGGRVTLTSRSGSRADQAASGINDSLQCDRVTGMEVLRGDQVQRAGDAEMVFACGAAGVELMTASQLASVPSLRVAVDLNAVPPAGLGGIEATAKAQPIEGSHNDAVAYGPIGVGGLKMKTHRAAIESLFETNDRWLDADEIFDLARSIG